MHYFNSNHTGFCQTDEMIRLIGNLTAPYADKGVVVKMVAAPVIVSILVALFFAGIIFGFSAVLDPKYRLLLSSALSLALPVMSYLFSEAKDAASEGGTASELSVRAWVILTWMLALELLRKMVDKIRVRGSYSTTLQRAGRVVWLGSLVYFNVTSAGRKAVFSILWILCATILVQRIAFSVVEKRSYPDKSWIIFHYMAQMLAQKPHHEELVRRHHNLDYMEQIPHGNELLKRCKYIVMGEEKLVREVTPYGYELKDITQCNSVITVGKVWELAENDHFCNVPDRHGSIRRVSLSFSLFKLLRRRFEHLPELTDEEAVDCRQLLMKGLYSSNGERMEVDEALFQVMADEIKFLSEYYHSVVPVVLASPLFVLVNYFVLPIAVLGLCLIVVLLCGNGGVSYVFTMSADNYNLHPGFANQAICALVKASHSRPAFFLMLDLCITALLFGIFFLEEIWEFLVILISNWFVVSMLCYYVGNRHWRESPVISGAFSWILWLQRKMSKYANIRLKQFCLLDDRGPIFPFMPAKVMSLKLRTSVPATGELKGSIMNYLVKHGSTDSSLCLYKSELYNDLCAGGSDSVTEVVLTWHIATCLLDSERLPSAHIARMKEEVNKNHKTAMSLSRYCAYLVVFHPELLPDIRDKAKLVLQDARKELRDMLGFPAYYWASKRTRINRLMEFQVDTARLSNGDRNKVVLNGVRLARHLMERDRQVIWKLVAEVWTELMVYAAPSSDEEHVNAHAEVIAEGVELVTVLWAFAMHTGISRRQRIQRTRSLP